MSPVPDRDEVLRSLATSLGLGPADLRRIAEQFEVPHTVSVAEFAPVAIERCGPKTRPCYAVHIRRLVEAHGDRRLDEITTDDLAALRDRIRADVAAAKIARAESTGRLLVSGDPDAHGHGAAENVVRAVRFLFKLAVDRRLITYSPAAAVKIPTRPPAPERPLTSDELQEFAVVACTTGNDPHLDGLLFEFHRKTAARREGALNLRVCDLDARGGAVTLTEKFGRSRRLPLDAEFISRLVAHATSRGATSQGDKVFRSSRGTPISRKRYEYLYNRLDAHTTWSGMLDVGIHWIRHTTLDDVRTVTDERTAHTYAGHTDASGPTINAYTKVPFEGLVAAYEAIFGPRFTSEVSGSSVREAD
jgi:site-specific recombinase XerC